MSKFQNQTFFKTLWFQLNITINKQYLTEILFFILFKPLKCETSNFKSPFWFNNLESKIFPVTISCIHSGQNLKTFIYSKTLNTNLNIDICFICQKYANNIRKCDWNIFQAVKRGNFIIIPNFFQLRVKIVNKIIFLQTLVENVAKTFKKTAC